MNTDTIDEKHAEFVSLLEIAEANADSDVGRFMLWCDDNRDFLREAVAHFAKCPPGFVAGVQIEVGNAADWLADSQEVGDKELGSTLRMVERNIGERVPAVLNGAS